MAPQHKKCIHGKRATRCLACGGGSLCAMHGRRKDQCQQCQLCSHSKKASTCILCKEKKSSFASKSSSPTMSLKENFHPASLGPVGESRQLPIFHSRSASSPFPQPLHPPTPPLSLHSLSPKLLSVMAKGLSGDRKLAELAEIPRFKRPRITSDPSNYKVTLP